MRKHLALLLAMILVFTLTACGSGSETPPSADNSESQTNAPETAAPESGGAESIEEKETRENPLEGTGFDMPGLAFGYEIVDFEVVEGTEGDNFDKQITVHYATPQEALEAYTIYWEEFYGRADSNGNKLGFPMKPEDMSDTADSFTFKLKYGTAVSEEDAQNMVGVFYLREMVGDDNTNKNLASGWKNKSYYNYIVITEDKIVKLYAVQGKDKAMTNSWGLNEITEYITLDGDELILQDGSQTLIFERTDEITDPEG